MPELQRKRVRVGALTLHMRVAVNDAEGAPTVVLVHGAAVSSRNMAPTAQALAPHCTVYAPDLPGHGLSDDPPRVLDVAGLADALAAWMDAVGLQRACLLGNSFGCQVITSFALRHPDRVDRLVLQGPTVDPQAPGFLRQCARWLVNGMREGATQPTVTFRDWYDAGLPGFVLTIRYMLRDRIEERLPLVDVPTLVVRGGRDPIVPQRWAEAATALLPNGRLVVVPGETHTMVFANPGALVRVVLPLLHGETDPGGTAGISPRDSG